MTPHWEGLRGLWRRDENSKNGDVIWIGAGVRYTFRQEWWTAQMWDGECWQLLPGSTFPCGLLSVLQILVAHQVPSAAVVFLSPEFVMAWACRGSGLSWTLYSLAGFPYEALRATIGQWAGNLAMHTESSLHIHGISFLHTMSCFPLTGYCHLSHCLQHTDLLSRLRSCRY